jgi:hypothetical protein
MKSLTTFSLSIIVFVTILSAGCDKKGGDNPSGGDSAIVYLAGTSGSGEPAPPCYWKNQTITNLPATFGGDGYSIRASGSNVYVGGRIYTNGGQSHFIPCFWINGNMKELPLPKPKSVGIVKSISTSDGVVYGAGLYSDSLPWPVNKWFYQPGVWKSNDDEITPLEVLDKLPISGQGWYGMAEGITTISNGNATGWCVVGSSQGPEGYSDPCFWTKGLAAVQIPDDEIEAQPLENLGYGGAALAVASFLDPKFQGDLSQSELFMAGYVNDVEGLNVPCYWYKGEKTTLPKISANDNAAATAIFYANGNLYIAGYGFNVGEQIPCVWKGQVRTDLPLPSGAFGGKATGVVTRNNDVYVSGTISTPSGEYPCQWKNGQIVQYTTRGSANGIALD